MISTKNVRTLRVFNVGAVIINVAALALDLAAGQILLAILNAAFALGSAAAIRVNTVTIRRMERPDYAAIARMEREVYGEVSEEAQIMLAHAELQARIAVIGRRSVNLDRGDWELINIGLIYIVAVGIVITVVLMVSS